MRDAGAVRRHRPGTPDDGVSRARSDGGRSQELDDLAQEVFLRLYRALPHFERHAQLSTYLYRIAINVAQDEWRRRRAARVMHSLSDPETAWENRLPHPVAGADRVLERQQLWDVVQRCLGDLSEPERAALSTAGARSSDASYGRDCGD